MHIFRDVIFAKDNEEIEPTFIHLPLNKGKQIVEDFLPSQSSTPCSSSTPTTSSSTPTSSSSTTPLDPGSPFVDQPLQAQDVDVQVTSMKKLPKGYTQTV